MKLNRDLSEIIRNSGYAEVPLVRKCSNKFGISLTYS